MKEFRELSEWQFNWGSPRGLFFESEGRKLEIAFLVAILLHSAPLGYLWNKQLTKKALESITLQNVDLIEPEMEQPAPPPVVVQKPKSAFEFLKMAIPIFRKPVPVQEAPRDIIPAPKLQEPKIAEPDKLIEKKMPNLPNLPQIKLDASRNMPAPKAIDLAKLPSSKQSELKAREPALKLEEVGRRAVAVPAQTPSISLDSSRKAERVIDITSLPKTQVVAQHQQQERLVERDAPVAYKAPTRVPLGYEKRGGGSLSLDQPRDVVRTTPKPKVESLPVKTQKKNELETLQISKERVKITGPLSARKYLKYFVPDYPAWARAKNLEADVAIRFIVSPGGSVRDSLVVERTSGYPELDKLALDALKKWQFSALTSGDQDQWGVITFRFLLE